VVVDISKRNQIHPVALEVLVAEEMQDLQVEQHPQVQLTLVVEVVGQHTIQGLELEEQEVQV
jgi:hypothetical protein